MSSSPDPKSTGLNNISAGVDLFGKTLTSILAIGAIVAFFVANAPGIGLILLVLVIGLICFFVIYYVGKKWIIVASIIGGVLLMTALITSFLLRPVVGPSVGFKPEAVPTLTPAPTPTPTPTPLPTPTPDDSVLPIEKSDSFTLYPYTYGTATNSIGVKAIIVNKKLITGYEFQYKIANAATSADGTGFSLLYSLPQDLSSYNSIEFTIGFGDANGRTRFYIKDSQKHSEFVPLGDGSLIKAQHSQQIVQIPLQKNFPSILWKTVTELVFETNGDFVHGDNSISVSNIQFRK
jgi:hypothetical protein